VLQCARLSDVPKNSDLSLHTAVCAMLRHCQHSLLMSVVCGIEGEDKRTVLDLKVIAKLSRSCLAEAKQ
jgi:hypothetical protein